jgi:uncharacterized protein (TIGR00369 family)
MPDLASYFGTETLRTGETTASTHLTVHDDLRDRGGALRAGAIAYAVDVATGLAMGLAVLDRDLWVVTTDLDVDVVAPVRDGPLRVDGEVLRAGATTAVSAFTLHDEGAGRLVGGGTCTGRPFLFEFDRALLEVPVGTFRRHGQARRPEVASLVGHLGFRVGEDATVEVDAADGLRNPWGILHGGVTACLADVAAETAGSAALRRPVRVERQLIRYLAPVRTGPARAEPTVLAIEGDRALVEVRVVDVGAADRLAAVTTLAVR